MSIVRFATGPKRPMGHLLGAEKGNFLIRGRGRPTVYGGRAGGILSIPAKEVSLGSPRVGTIHVQTPTPHAWALPSVGTYKQGPLRSTALDHDLPKISIQSSLESPKYRRMRRRRLPMSTNDPRRPRGDLRTTNRQDSIDAPALVASSISRIKKN